MLIITQSGKKLRLKRFLMQFPCALATGSEHVNTLISIHIPISLPIHLVRSAEGAIEASELCSRDNPNRSIIALPHYWGQSGSTPGSVNLRSQVPIPIDHVGSSSVGAGADTYSFGIIVWSTRWIGTMAATCAIHGCLACRYEQNGTEAGVL